MPGLSSFCITAAVCIAFIFVLQVSWTVAWLVLDQQRIERNRHGIFPWLTIKEEIKEVEFQKDEISKKLMKTLPHGTRASWISVKKRVISGGDHSRIVWIITTASLIDGWSTTRFANNGDATL